MSRSANVGRGEPRTLYVLEKSAPDNETVRSADPAEEVHHHLGITKRKLRGEDEARDARPGARSRAGAGRNQTSRAHDAIHRTTLRCECAKLYLRHLY